MKLYDKKILFQFPIVNFPFICSNIPAAPAYGVYISQLLQYPRARGSYHDFPDRELLLTKISHIPLLTPNIRCSGKVSSLCSTCGTCHVFLVTNPVINHEWVNDQIVITTNGTYLWSFVTRSLKFIIYTLY
jgi:hypothetical protein